MRQALGQQFAFAYQAKLKSEFENNDFISVTYSQEYSEPETYNPDILFTQLQQGKTPLNLIQMLILMGWDSKIWNGYEGHSAMESWWHSALEQEQQGNDIPKKMMVLRSVLADRERYPGPEPVIRIMRKQLKNVVQRQFLQPEERTVILTLLEQNAHKLALFAWQCRQSVTAVLIAQNLPYRLPLVREANLDWLVFWMNGTELQRKQTIPALKSLLNQQDLSAQLAYAHIILENDAVYNKIVQCQEVLVSYAELVRYLSLWNRQREFKSGLSTKQLQRLNHWLGTGNYQTLKNILHEIVHFEAQYASAEDDVRRAIKTTSKNRYLFWEHYQHLFRETWLLVSEQIYSDYAACREIDNIKKVSGLTYPKILIRLGDYFIIQTFVQKGIGVDLVMTTDVGTVEYWLSQDTLSASNFEDLSLCLIHDHVFLWQEALARTLSQHFAILKKNHHQDMTDIQNSESLTERNRQLGPWKKAARQRYGSENVNRLALSLISL